MSDYHVTNYYIRGTMHIIFYLFKWNETQSQLNEVFDITKMYVLMYLCNLFAHSGFAVEILQKGAILNRKSKYKFK